MSNRPLRALAVGSAAAAAYLAGARLKDGRPVRLATLAGLFVVASAAVMNSSPSAKAYAAHDRIDDMLANGFTVGGPVTINARVDIKTANLHMNGNNIQMEGGTVVP